MIDRLLAAERALAQVVALLERQAQGFRQRLQRLAGTPTMGRSRSSTARCSASECPCDERARFLPGVVLVWAWQPMVLW